METLPQIPEKLTMADYQRLSALVDKKTVIEGSQLMYYAIGLVDEVGELFGKVKKLHRDHEGVMVYRWIKTFKSELGDVIWYVTQILSHFRVDFVGLGVRPYRSLPENLEPIIVKAAKIYSLVQSEEYKNSADTEAEILNMLRDIVSEVKGISKGVFDWTLEDIARANLEKLFDRAERGKIQGNGDER